MSEIFRHTKKNVLKLFRKLSLSNPKTAESATDCTNAKYKPQKNNSITISPLNLPPSNRKRTSGRKKDHRKHKNRDVDDEEDDFTVPTGGKHRRSYIKSCMKKFNNNYEKQINCIQDENMVFTDNKIYISLARNSSLTSSIGGNNSLKKNRRVIYPTSGGYKLTGFLRDYDFNYESPTKEGKTTSTTDFEEKLKFNMVEEGASKAAKADDIVFEKVKVSNKKSPKKMNNEISSFDLHVTNDDEEKNDDSILTSSTFVAEWNHCEVNSYEADDEDDVQWKNFLELRKHKTPSHDTASSQPCRKLTLSDSGFGSQLFSNIADKNNKSLDTWLDDETYDNSFNEELEHKVSIMFPDLYKNNSQAAYYNNINNTNHEKRDKFE